jgi:hypothetical protein
MSIKEYYSKKSKYKKWGDALLVACPLLSTAVIDLPLSDAWIKWILFFLNLGTIGGKLLLNRYDAKQADEKNA